MSLKRSFICAGRGIKAAVRGERNLRIHLVAAVMALFCAYLGEVEPWGWTAVITVSALVISAEMLNSALERLSDKVQPHLDPVIRDVKDIASGSVLVCAIASVLVACAVFLRFDVLANLARRPFELALLALLSPVLIWALSKAK